MSHMYSCSLQFSSCIHMRSLLFLLGNSDTLAETQAKNQVSVVCCIQSKQYICNFFFFADIYPDS